MAAYAALVSLTHIIEEFQSHVRHSTSIDKQEIESLLEKVVFFQEFVEDFPHGDSKEAQVLEGKIAYVAYAAEDVIESHVVDRIIGGPTSSLLDLQNVLEKMDSIKERVMGFREKWRLKDDKSTRSSHFLCGLQRVMENLDPIGKRVKKVKEKKGFKDMQLPRNSIPSTSSRTPARAMVGLDDNLIRLMERLVGQHPKREIIPIVGMGGIGKTTLARNVYENSVTVQHFDIRAWVTVSHNYSVQEILLELLSCYRKHGSCENLVSSLNDKGGETEDQLGEKLYKSLSGRRYLVIADDVWSIDAWDKIRLFFPDNGNGSRIIVTTRLSNVATHFGPWHLQMNFLDEDASWDLFCEKAFPQEDCPSDLEEVGKKIARKCKGLPLSIVVIAGVLGKTHRTQEYWENVAKDINSILNSEEDEHCLRVLSLSYSHLPLHLKPCFLYMGIFPEDHEIHVSHLIKLWVAEGFLKPDKTKSLEDVAEGHVKDLIERNLIIVRSLRSNGKIKTCSIHDILRELCLKVAQKEKFLCVVRALAIPHSMDRVRRVVFHESIPTKKYQHQVIRALQSASNARSVICKGGPLPLKFKLLRILDRVDRYSLEAIFKQVNLRYLAYKPTWRSIFELPSSMSLLWNMQTLIIKGASERIVAPPEIWGLPRLRHLELDEICLPDPPPDNDFAVLENLQTLSTVVNLRCTEEVIERIPNIKSLKLKYDDFSGESDRGSSYCLHNLGRFRKLESLKCLFYKQPNQGDLMQNLTIPNSLKKLTLKNCNLCWEDLTMIGSLPCLEVFKLKMNSVTGPEWSPIEGQFLRLKFLQIYGPSDLILWNADSTHFPVLEKLVLDHFFSLKEIPPGIGDIPTLRLIHLKYCTYSIAVSAKNILEEQHSMGNEGLQVRVRLLRLLRHSHKLDELASLATENFLVETVSTDDLAILAESNFFWSSRTPR